MTIIEFPDTRENLIRRNNEEKIENVKSKLGILLTKTPNNINDIINQNYESPEKLIVIDIKELKALVIDYIIYHLQCAKISLEGSVIFSMQYMSDLISKFLLFQGEEVKIIAENPYFTHWMNEGYPKRAGDASVYSYIFRSFDKKPINKEDYIGFATSAYLEYSKDRTFANGIGNILPIVGNITKDEKFLNRGPIRKK